jgi:NSS family neurotransmitter:Na+ symporter
MTAAPRDSWNSSAGFILALVGSAVGLGNLWRFAYTTSTSGGAAFVLVYLVFVFGIGIPIFAAELAIGRATGMSPIRALDSIGGPRWRFVGGIFVFTGFGVLSYYSVIMGWVGRMLVDSIRGGIPADTAAYFAGISTGAGAVVFHLMGLGIAVFVVQRGIRRGIERAATLLMPMLFLLLIALAVWSLTLPGGGPGYAFYLRPRLDTLLDGRVIAGAAGQAFFSLSLGMGAIITYASYLRGQHNLPGQAVTVGLGDTSVALLGGLVTFPIIFHFGLQDVVLANPSGALFIALPQAFHQMGGAGMLIGPTFFIALYIAAITSAFSLLEVVVSGLIDGRGITRHRATLLAGATAALAGIPAALSPGYLALIDKLVGEAMLVLGGAFIALLTGWVWWRGASAELARGFPHPRVQLAWIWMLRTVIPIILVIVLVTILRQVGPLARALLGS